MEAETKETEKQKTVHQTQTKVIMRLSFLYITSVINVLHLRWYDVRANDYVAASIEKFLVAHAMNREGRTIAVCFISLN